MSTLTRERSVSGPPPHRPARRWQAVAALVTATLMIVAVVLLAMTASDRDGQGRPMPGASAPVTPAGTGPAAGAAPATGTRSAAPSTATGGTAPFRFLPLWPFGTAQEAVHWQGSAGAGGHQPWRLDASATALAFTTGFLGFDPVDRAIGVVYSGDESWVEVGFRTQSGLDVTAAEIHLARIGAGGERPWEVVGTRDTTLRLTTPRYGATVTSPVAMGGRITGVDESLRLQVRALAADGVLGELTGIAAGGRDEPWTGRVTFAARTGTVLTLVVSTGGHAGPGVERFAIMGVRAG